jgi:hypothetical protein
MSRDDDHRRLRLCDPARPDPSRCGARPDQPDATLDRPMTAFVAEVHADNGRERKATTISWESLV